MRFWMDFYWYLILWCVRQCVIRGWGGECIIQWNEGVGVEILIYHWQYYSPSRWYVCRPQEWSSHSWLKDFFPVPHELYQSKLGTALPATLWKNRAVKEIFFCSTGLRNCASRSWERLCRRLCEKIALLKRFFFCSTGLRNCASRSRHRFCRRLGE